MLSRSKVWKIEAELVAVDVSCVPLVAMMWWNVVWIVSTSEHVIGHDVFWRRVQSVEVTKWIEEVMD